MDKTRRVFRRFVRRVISWAYTEAYLSPTPSFVLAFRHRLGEGFGLSVVAPLNLVLEASSRNLRLSYGFCDSVLAAADSALVEDLSGQKCNRLRALTFADGVLKSALRAVSIFDQVIPGPYFFVSTEHSGVVKSLALFPVHRTSANICFIDSRQEGRRAAELERLGTYAYKSLRVDDQNRVIRHLAKMLGHSASWYEFRSDFLYLSNDYAVAEELRGFKLGQNQYYDQLMAYKRSVLENHPCRSWLIPLETFPQDIVEVVDRSMSLEERFDFPIEVEKSAWVKVLSAFDREVVGTP